jgi:hypothetical protein|tara:strand:- start:2731 stop:2919 length:189 start_codon:yes stop_codon:yes gene_type:complete
MFTTEKQIRDAFWQSTDNASYFIEGKTQNEYNTNIRVEFCDFVEMLRSDKQISEELANNVTL